MLFAFYLEDGDYNRNHVLVCADSEGEAEAIVRSSTGCEVLEPYNIEKMVSAQYDGFAFLSTRASF